MHSMQSLSSTWLIHRAGPTEGKHPVARGAHGAFVDGGYMYIFGGICVDELQAPTCAPAPGKLPETCSCHAPSGRVQVFPAAAPPHALAFNLHAACMLHACCMLHAAYAYAAYGKL